MLLRVELLVLISPKEIPFRSVGFLAELDPTPEISSAETASNEKSFPANQQLSRDDGEVLSIRALIHFAFFPRRLC